MTKRTRNLVNADGELLEELVLSGPADYELWESLILSEQVPAAALTALLRDDPQFRLWLAARAERRQGYAAGAGEDAVPLSHRRKGKVKRGALWRVE